MTETSELRAHVEARAENRPGVYRMEGPAGSVLYVGKSVRVRTRLLSYFRAPPTEKAGELIRASRRVEWEYVPDDFAAVVREYRLIQRWLPRYNVEHKHIRTHSFLTITRDAAPRLVAVTRVAEDGGIYFGPYAGRERIREAARDLARVVGLRDCPAATPVRYADQGDLFGHGFPPECIRAELETCPAPCAGGITESGYRRRVALARAFLEGRTDRPLAELRRRMRAAAGRRDYEYAALLRDRARRLRRVRDEGVACRGTEEGLSFLYPVEGWEGGTRIYLLRGGRVRDEFPAPATPGERRRTVARIREVYAGPDARLGQLDAEALGEILLTARWFRRRPGERARTVTPEAWGREAAA